MHNVTLYVMHGESQNNASRAPI